MLTGSMAGLLYLKTTPRVPSWKNMLSAFLFSGAVLSFFVGVQYMSVGVTLMAFLPTPCFNALLAKSRGEKLGGKFFASLTAILFAISFAKWSNLTTQRVFRSFG
ncbi:MAG TPA: hypothetical protein VEA59_03945 [Patescibacteria group bacterium]|nr:hypothetical protein [Patescibacteria group bacterium]